MTDNQAFKDFLKQELKDRDWNQADLLREAQRIQPDIDLGKATISRWLDEAAPTAPDLDNLLLLSLVLKTGIETLLKKLYPDQFYATHLAGLSADARLLAERFDKYPEFVQKAILLLMRQAIE